MRHPQAYHRFLFRVFLLFLAISHAMAVASPFSATHLGFFQSLVKRDLSQQFQDNSDKLSTGLVWAYTMISITIITFLAVLGVFLFPLVSSRSPAWNHMLMTFLVGLGVGTLLGDAFLHLYMNALGLHSHDHNADHAAHDAPSKQEEHVHRSNQQDALGISLTLIGGLLFFFLADHVCRLLCPGGSHQHVHHHPPVPPHVDESFGLGSESPADHTRSFSPEEARKARKPMLRSPDRHVMWLILMGDAIHNFMDGVALGITFSKGSTSGWSTALTVFLHELPHELGDVAVLLSSGIPRWRTALFNMISNLPSYLGGILGILVYNALSDRFKQHVLAFTAGGFIYIALVNLTPMLMNLVHKEQPVIHSLRSHVPGKYMFLFFQCLGIVIGIGCMVLMSIYEPSFESI